MKINHLLPPPRKIFGALLIGAAMISSCNVEEPQEKMLLTTNEIGLNAVSKTGTKGYVEDVTLKDTPYDKLYDGLADDAKADRTITMSAWLYPQSGAGQEYFHAEKFTINANGETDNLWHHNPKVYWPLGGTLDFLAYSVNTDFPQTAVSWNREKPTDGLSLRVDRRYTQDDILFAAAGARGANRGAAVEMVFKHAQAWLEFNVHAEENGIVTLDAIEVENLYSDGRLDVKNVSGTTTASWNFDSNTALNTVVDDTPGAFGRVLGTSVRHFDMLVPQQPMHAFVIKYRLSGIDMPLQYRYELPVAYWEMGKKYIYDITLSPKEITVSPIVTEWDVVSEDWVYATATHIDAVGSTFTFSDRSLYYWRAEAPAGGGGGPTAGTSSFSPRTKSYDGTDAGGYELLQYVSGEYGDRVKFKSSTGEQVTMFSESIQRDVEIEVKEDPLAQPLTFTFSTGGSLYLKASSSSIERTVKYSLNGGDYNAVTSSLAGTLITDVLPGDVIRLVADYSDGKFCSSTSDYITFPVSDGTRFSVSGNIMSLLQSTGFESLDVACRFSGLFLNNSGIVDAEKLLLPSTYLFGYRMFRGCINLINAPAELPAETGSYTEMFWGCTALKKGPEIGLISLSGGGCSSMFQDCISMEHGPSVLRPDTLMSQCYNNMFTNCHSLVSAPKILATTTQEKINNSPTMRCCYYMFAHCHSLVNVPDLEVRKILHPDAFSYMFYDCSSLVDAPALPATVLSNNCYAGMFADCTSLVNAPSLPATTLSQGCYSSMFNYCTSLIDAPELPAIELKDYCYSGMFNTCTSLVNAPELPAPVLVESCYLNMFQYCSSLARLVCLAEDISAHTCYNFFLDGAASTGTFVAANRSVAWSTGHYSKIPSGWTVVYADEL